MAYSFSKYDVVKALMKSEKSDLVASLKWIGEAGEDPAMAMGYTDAVAKCLSNPDSDIIAATCVALGNMGFAAERYVSAISALLASGVPGVRAAAAKALGNFGSMDPMSTSKIATVAEDDSDVGVRVAAITALGTMRAEGEADLLKKMLKSDADVACAAVMALGLMGLADDGTAIVAMLGKPKTKHAALSALVSMAGATPVMCLEKVVTEGLTDKDSVVRELAVTVVAAVPEAAVSSIGKIKPLLSNKDAGVRAAAAMALGAIGTDAASESAALVPLLTDDGVDPAVAHMALTIGSGAKKASSALRMPKCAALAALGSMKATGCLESIANCTNDGNWEVRLAAVDSLASFGKDATECTEKVIVAMGDVAYPVRAAACGCLGAIKAEDNVDDVVGMLKDSAHSVRVAALFALIDFGEAAWAFSHDVFKLVKDDALPCRQASIRCLSLMGDIGTNYAGVAAMMLNDESPEMRCEACEALGRMGASGAAYAEDVSELLSDRAAMVSEAAGRSLTAMGSEGLKYLYMQGYLEPPSLEDGQVQRKLPELGVGKAYVSDLERERAKLGL